jgi:hypothetical protein
MFPSQPDRRLTLFVVDPLYSNFVIPKVRYSLGQRVLTAEFRSNARYQRGEGATGRAWENPDSLVFNDFPQFVGREEFETHYVGRLRIPRDTVKALSDYMVRVRGIWSYAFTDYKGDLLGILSIDIQGDDTQLNADSVKKLIQALGAVLEAHSFRAT